MAVVGSGFGIVEDGLVRDGNIKDLLQDISSFAGGDSEGHVEGQNKAEDILGVVNSSDVDEWFDWGWMDKFCGLE